MRNKRFTIRQMVETKINKKFNKRRTIFVTEPIKRIELVYDEEGNLEWLDIQCQTQEPYEVT